MSGVGTFPDGQKDYVMVKDDGNFFFSMKSKRIATYLINEDKLKVHS